MARVAAWMTVGDRLFSVVCVLTAITLLSGCQRGEGPSAKNPGLATALPSGEKAAPGKPQDWGESQRQSRAEADQPPGLSSSGSQLVQPETPSPDLRPMVPSGWIIPEDQPTAPANSSVSSETSPRQNTTTEPAPLPVGKAQPETPRELPAAAPAQSQVSADRAGTASASPPPEALPNPLRGGTRPGEARPQSLGGSSGESPSSLSGGPGGTAQPSVVQTAQSGRRLERPSFDPIKENGEFFVGWTKPRFAMVFTGRLDGYFEPCGCAGKDRMKGGLSRRHTMIRQLRERGWPLVVMDVGGLIKSFGKQTEVKFQVTVDALRTIGYDAIALGRNDLRLPAPLLLSAIAPTNQESSEFVSANVALFDFASDQWTSRYRVLEVAGRRVGITAILGKSFFEEIRNPDLAFMDPAEALSKVVPELKKQADILVLLAYAGEEEAFELVKRFPEFSVLAMAEGPAEPPGSPRFVPGTQTMLVYVGEKGMTAVVLGFYDNPEQPVAYQRIILDSRYPDSPEMKQMMVNYQNQLQSLGLAGLEIRPMPHPRREIQGEYVGSEKCANCHEKSYMIWKKSGHAKAWETLVRLDPPRTFDPECISCHVTGWHPTRYFPYESGFLSEKETPHLIDVGCESCHGPGSEHVAAEMSSDIEWQQRAAKAMVVTKEEAEHSEVHNCRNCHDLDNSPDFDFAKYWPLVEHYEKE